MADTWNVSAAYDKSSYIQGETMHIALTGDYVRDVVQHAVAGPLSVPVVSVETGASKTLNVGPVDISWVTQAHEEVVVDPSGTIVDQSGRTWVIDANGKGITAVA